MLKTGLPDQVTLKIDPHSSHLPLRDLWAFKKSLNALLNAFYFLFIDMRPWKTRAEHTQFQAQFELENSIENKSCQKSTRQCTSVILFGLNCEYSAKISDKKNQDLWSSNTLTLYNSPLVHMYLRCHIKFWYVKFYLT